MRPNEKCCLSASETRSAVIAVSEDTRLADTEVLSTSSLDILPDANPTLLLDLASRSSRLAEDN